MIHRAAETRIERARAGAKIFFEMRLKKKSRATALLGKLCRPYFPECFDLSLIDGATLLVRARAPPETWTTRRNLSVSLRIELVADLFGLVTIFGNDCSNLRHSAKRSKSHHPRLRLDRSASWLSSPVIRLAHLTEFQGASGFWRYIQRDWFEALPIRLWA
jgi:hypothetical protein